MGHHDNEKAHLVQMHGMRPELFDRMVAQRNAKGRKRWHQGVHQSGEFADYNGHFTEEECWHEDANSLAVQAIVMKNRLYRIPGGKYVPEGTV